MKTQSYIDADAFISQDAGSAFADQANGITVTNARIYYLAGTKEVILGRPVLEPDGLLPEQQLRRMSGKVVEASVKKVEAHPGDRYDHIMIMEKQRLRTYLRFSRFSSPCERFAAW